MKVRMEKQAANARVVADHLWARQSGKGVLPGAYFEKTKCSTRFYKSNIPLPVALLFDIKGGEKEAFRF